MPQGPTCRCEQHRESTDRPPVEDRLARLWTREDICWYASCAQSTLDTYLAEADFPAPLALPGRLARWRRADVEAWFASRDPRQAPKASSRPRAATPTGARASATPPETTVGVATAAGLIPVPRRAARQAPAKAAQR